MEWVFCLLTVYENLDSKSTKPKLSIWNCDKPIKGGTNAFKEESM